MKAVLWPADDLQELRMPKLVFVAQGHVGFRLADYVLRCPPGTGIFLPPGAPHTNGTTSHFEPLSGEGHSCSLVWFTSMISGLNCRMCHARDDHHISASEGEKIFLQNSRLLQLINFVNEELNESQGEESAGSKKYDAGRQARLANPPIFEGLFLSFMRSVIRDITREKFYLSLEAVPAADHEIGLLNSEPIEQVVQYAKTHFAHPLTIDEMSRRFFISRARLTRQFREHTGQSFLEYVNACRLEQARNLLEESEWTAAMIGRYVGFRSPAHFHRLFLRERGVSPAAYRREIRRAK
jgi:AraC-like DNA-binding protein